MVHARFQPPGLYEVQGERRHSPIRLRERGTAGFIGVAHRGPLNLPVLIREFDQFAEVYGQLDAPTFLEPAVRGFFENGGRECYVLRVAHLDVRQGGQVATVATARMPDAAGQHTLLVESLNEGSWGNAIQVEAFVPRQIPRTFLTLDLREGGAEATVKSTHGIERGTPVRVFDDDGHEEVFTVQEVDGRRLIFAPGEAAARDHASNAPTYVEPVVFGLRARYLGTEEVFDGLNFGPLSAHYVEAVINTRSTLIRVKNLRSPSPAPTNLPAPDQPCVLEDGADGVLSLTPGDFIGANRGPDARFGLAAFEEIEDVDLLCVPDLVWAHEHSTGFHSLQDVEAVQQALISQCERLRDRFALLDLPEATSPAGALRWRQLFDSPYAAFYFPWVLMETPDGPLQVPASGPVAGVFARCDLESGLHRAPANEELHGVLDVGVSLNDGDLGTLNQHGINCLRPFQARGIRVWGARTLSSDPSQRYVPVRRITSAIIRAMQHDLQWVVFEPHTPSLRKKVLRNVGYFLYDLWKRGYFKGASPEEAFFVKCDEENNPPDQREQGMLFIDVGVAPVRPAEFVVFQIMQDMEVGAEQEA